MEVFIAGLIFLALSAVVAFAFRWLNKECSEYPNVTYEQEPEEIFRPLPHGDPNKEQDLDPEITWTIEDRKKTRKAVSE